MTQEQKKAWFDAYARKVNKVAAALGTSRRVARNSMKLLRKKGLLDGILVGEASAISRGIDVIDRVREKAQDIAKKVKPKPKKKAKPKPPRWSVSYTPQEGGGSRPSVTIQPFQGFTEIKAGLAFIEVCGSVTEAQDVLSRLMEIIS